MSDSGRSNDPTAPVVERQRARIAARVTPLITEELIAEHRACPIGQHSDALQRVLTHLRTDTYPARYVVVRTESVAGWNVGLFREHASEVELLDGGPYASEADAQHAVFLAQIGDLLSGARPDLRRGRAPVPRPELIGYADQLAVAAGETIAFHVHSDPPGPCHAVLVRHLGPGDAAPVTSPIAGTLQGLRRDTRPGSHIGVDDAQGRLAAGAAVSLHVFVCPSAARPKRQAILSRAGAAGYTLGLTEDGALAFWAPGGDLQPVALTGALSVGTWYAIGCVYEPRHARVVLHARPLASSANSRTSRLAAHPAMSAELVSEPVTPAPACLADPTAFVIGAGVLGDGHDIGDHFNGKLARPSVYGRPLTVEELDRLSEFRELTDEPAAQWDFATEITPDGVRGTEVLDPCSGLRGVCVNNPTRAVTGPRWDGTVLDYRFAADQYDAIWFHDDDLDDAGWPSDGALTVDDALESGLYSLRLESESGARDEIPFFVTPCRGSARPPVAFLAPTATYLAYANQVAVLDREGELLGGRAGVVDDVELALLRHRELAYSTYDQHTDGSGIMFSSRLRPILTMRPEPRAGGARWGLAADLCLLGWLENTGQPFDVITDEDLHHEGADALAPYRVLLTGTHPEYTTAAMLDALEGHIDTGGRLMYLGGNGFYWVVSFDPDRPHILEVRKHSGTRAWDAGAGERHHSGTGEPGGIWRLRGRAPQKLVGVGFGSQGFDVCSHFVAADDAPAFVFEGVRDPQRIGAHGLVGGGAAGLELDRFDPGLGSPADTHVLASSVDHTDTYTHVVEEIEVMRPGYTGTQDAGVRADMVLTRTSNGGAVFSTGSIAWCTSLPNDDYDNDVATITGNVLRAFLAEDLPPR